MGFKKHLFILVLLLLPWLLGACTKSQPQPGECSLADKRFACIGSLSADGRGELKFTRAPSEQIFELSQLRLSKPGAGNRSVGEQDCQFQPGEVKPGSVFHFRCRQPLPAGTYYLKFNLTHRMPKNYRPRKSESCALSRSGIITAWQCVTTGQFKYIIKPAPTKK